MKKIVGILGLTCVLVACSVTRKYDTTGFTIDKNYVYYQDEPMCELVGIEFALDDHKLVKELTFKVVDNSNNSKITELIAFLHEKHPDYEIEIEIPFEHMDPIDHHHIKVD
jgi:hypothetical protein